MTDSPPEFPPEPNRQGCLGLATAVLAVLLAGSGLMTLIGSGLCTAFFATQPGVTALALVMGLPTMAVGYGVWRLGRWLLRRNRPNPDQTP